MHNGVVTGKVIPVFSLIWEGGGEGERKEGTGCQVKTSKKIQHTGNTRTSHICVIQEYRFYTMSPCQYHEYISIPQVLANNMTIP